MVEELIISVRSIQTILNLVKIITNIFLSCDSVACIYLFLILINVWCLCLTNNALTICWWTWVNIGLISILTDAWVTEQLLGADSTETPVTPPTSTVEKLHLQLPQLKQPLLLLQLHQLKYLLLLQLHLQSHTASKYSKR